MEAEEKRAQVEQTIRRYEEAFDRMLVLAKTSTTDKLVSSFLHNEDRNFALFNYVSEIHGEIEKLISENSDVSGIVFNAFIDQSSTSECHDSFYRFQNR